MFFRAILTTFTLHSALTMEIRHSSGKTTPNSEQIDMLSRLRTIFLRKFSGPEQWVALQVPASQVMYNFIIVIVFHFRRSMAGFDYLM